MNLVRNQFHNLSIFSSALFNTNVLLLYSYRSFQQLTPLEAEKLVSMVAGR